MRVDPNRDLSRAVENSAVKPVLSQKSSKDAVELSGVAELAKRLSEVPDVRAEEVARAKALVQQPNYPSDSTLERVAGLLADKLGPKSE